MTTASVQLHCVSLAPQYPSHTTNFPSILQVQKYTEGLDAAHKALSAVALSLKL